MERYVLCLENIWMEGPSGLCVANMGGGVVWSMCGKHTGDKPVP